MSDHQERLEQSLSAFMDAEATDMEMHPPSQRSL